MTWHGNPFRAVLLCCLLLILPSSFLIAQQLSTDNKRAERLFYSAYDAYQGRALERALADIRKAVELDPAFTEAYLLLGDVLADNREFDKAIAAYESAIRTNRPFSPGLYLTLAGLQQMIGRYSDARLNYTRLLESPGLPPARQQQAEKGISACDFALTLMAHPVPFMPVTVGDSINTKYDEYVNAVTADGEWLYFTRKNPRDSLTTGKGQDFEEDFYVAARADTGWKKAIALGPPINTHGNEGALSISPDGKYLFFAGCNRDDGYGSCDIYWSERRGDRWAEPRNMGPVVNSPQWDSQPSFSSDGKTLFFASKRPGGKGSSDIWMTRLGPDGEWSQPENLGDSVNTKAEEMGPFIHPDGRTLYFSSKGHPGMGGYDLFLSRITPTGGWKRPMNLGYPINTFSDEMTLVVTAKGDLAYISSDKLGGKGRQDIYRFPLYREVRPFLTTYLKGRVYDAVTGEKLEARFELIDLATSETAIRSVSDRENGSFLVVLPSERDYALNVSREGYLFYSDHFVLTGDHPREKPFLADIPLKPIRVGEAVVLKNVFFDTDLYSLKDESVAELEKLTKLLRNNPAMKIEISGHTDNVGTAEHNLALSKNRAGAVYQYLVDHGIDATRLTFAGYGFSRPIDDNGTEQGRANNRRTEFKVMAN